MQNEIQDEIAAIIRQPELFSKSSNFNVGFFSKPFLVKEGLLKGKVVKLYRPINDLIYCNHVKELHDNYVIELRKAGIRVPETELIVASVDSVYHLAIIQEAFAPSELVRDVMKTCEVEAYLELMEGVVKDTIGFTNYMSEHPQSLGFHPTLRNYAFRMGQFFYFDTFPPMAGISEDEVQQLIIDFAPYHFPGFVKKLSKKYLGRVTNEYYQYDLMISGIIGSSCRLRPEFADRVLIRARSILESSPIDENLREKTLTIIKNPPKLSPLWTSMRKLLGKEGKPNI
jgi:hypothetical protein